MLFIKFYNVFNLKVCLFFKNKFPLRLEEQTGKHTANTEKLNQTENENF